MAMSEVFNLDFKFGGNAEFLARLEALLERVDARFESVEDSVKDAAKATDDMADRVDDLNDSFKEGVGAMTSFGEKLKDIAQYYLSFQAIRMGAERVWSFGMESMDAYSTQERAENQLKGVMRNRGTLDQFQAIKDYAAQIQGRSIYGDEAMIRGAGELATYVKGTESLKSMMDLLTDYAAGMTGGGEVSPEQMESLATGLGMAYDGNYMAMRRKGFDTSKLEALDALAENGGVWGAKEKKKYGDVLDADLLRQARSAGGVTEQMRVDALKESLSDWQGLSGEVNKLDSSALVRFKNKLGDLREEIGKKLYPVFNRLVGYIDENMPTLERLYDSFAKVFETIATAIVDNLPGLTAAVEILGTAVRFLADYYRPILATVFAMKLVPPALKAISTASATAATSGLGGLAKALVGVVNPASLAATAIVGLGAVLWNMWDKSQKEQAKRTREISSEAADRSIAEVRKLDEEASKATNEYQKRGIAEAKKKALQRAAEQISLYAQSNDGYAKAEWADLFPTGLDMTDYATKRFLGKVKFRNPGENKDKNPFDDLKADMEKMMKESKTNLYQTFNTTNIEQKVNVAAEVEKIGMLLNFSVRAAIEQAMRQNQNRMTAGEM